MTEPNFSDVKELSDEDFSKLLDEKKATRDFKKYGWDGNVSVWRQTYSYRGIKYDIALNRYYLLGVPIFEIKGMNKYTRWFVLEYPENDKNTIELYRRIHEDDSEFLYKDTLHSWNENDTLEQMFYKMVIAAKKDIDNFLDKSESEIDARISQLNQLREEFKAFVDASTHPIKRS